MRDIQNENTGFPPYPIQAAGVKGIKGMMQVCTALGKSPLLLSSFSAACPLSAAQRGLNMSRIGRAIYAFLEENKDVPLASLEMLARNIAKAHGTNEAKVKASFTFPIEVFAPVTHIKGIKGLDIVMKSKILPNGTARNTLSVASKESSLCPCSKEMSLLQNNLTIEDALALEGLSASLKDKIALSGFGAHNQIVKIKAKAAYLSSSSLPIIELYGILCASASSPSYPVLKREDEKYATECAWKTPRFVEDIVRQAAVQLDSLKPAISCYSVTAKSYESIHSDGITAEARLTSL